MMKEKDLRMASHLLSVIRPMKTFLARTKDDPSTEIFLKVHFRSGNFNSDGIELNYKKEMIIKMLEEKLAAIRKQANDLGVDI